MSDFSRGVKFYTSKTAKVLVHFPEDDIKCQWCQFCRTENELKRWWCRLSNEIIVNPFSSGLPEFCLIEDEENEN